MKRIGLRRVFPWLSYAIRWILVHQMISDRTLARMLPEQRGRVLAAMHSMDRLHGI
jgi:hypothetical protein